jgi:hypothetical protein
VILGWLREIRDNKWLAVRALLVGSLAFLAVASLVVWLANLDEWLWVRGLIDIRGWWPDARRPILHVSIGAGASALTGWIVGYFHREHRTALVLLYFVFVLALIDLPRLVSAASASFRQAHFWLSMVIYFVFFRVTILVGGICGVRADATRTGFRKDGA